MQLRVEIEREEDIRWIAAIPALPGVMAYGDTRQDAVARVKSIAQRVIADRIEHDEKIPFGDMDAIEGQSKRVNKRRQFSDYVNTAFSTWNHQCEYRARRNMSSTDPDNLPSSPNILASQETIEILLSPSEEYEYHQRQRYINVRKQLGRWPLEFAVTHLIGVAASFYCILASTYVLRDNAPLAEQIPIVTLAMAGIISWGFSVAIAIYLVYLVFRNYSILPIRWRIAPLVPWGLICFETIIIPALM